MARETVKHPYDPDLISLLERTLFNDYNDGVLHAYEVHLDGIAIIRKTEDPHCFRDFEDYVNLDRNFKLLVKVFFGPTDCQRYEYTHRAERGSSVEEERSLSGLGSIAEQIAVERLRWDHDALLRREEEHRQTIAGQKQEIEKLKKDFDELSKEAEELRGRKLVLGNINLAELGGVIVEGMIRRNTHLLARHPLTKGLAGIIDEDNQDGNSPALESGQLSEEDEAYLDLLRKIQEAFSPQDFMRVLGLLDGFINDPSLIGPTEEFISQQTSTSIQTEQL